MIPGFPMFSLVLETELPSDHWSLKEAGTQFHFKFRPDSGIFVNNIFHKKHLGKKSIFLVLPFFPVSIWKNSGQWALTVCPTADEGQQLMLSHIPAHLPGGGNNKIPCSISQWQNTMKLLPTVKLYATSPSNETPCNISQGPQEQRCSVPWKASWMRQSKSCWDLSRPGWDRAGPACFKPAPASSRPVPFQSLTPLVSSSQTKSSSGHRELCIRPLATRPCSGNYWMALERRRKRDVTFLAHFSVFLKFPLWATLILLGVTLKKKIQLA